jgi:error-prone DNA polymerase
MDHFHLNVVVTSIIRPASNGSIHTWVSRLHGQPWEPPHPLLRPVLEETLGVMVFQEQLSQAAIHMAGFDPSEAEALRRVVSKKHKEKKLRDFCARFVEGARTRGVSPGVIEEVWQMMMGFDGYSFCKPHSASYTMVAYKSAFLRAHYPAEFMASVISNCGGYYSTFGYLSEARRMGLTILPPCINESDIPYTGKDKAVRVGLMQLKDLSREGMEAIVHERSKKGPFISFEDFLGRMRSLLHFQDLRILIKAGCFDAISRDMGRSGLMWQALRSYAPSSGPRQVSLFDDDSSHPLLYPPGAGRPSTIPRAMCRDLGQGEGVKPRYPKGLMLKHELEIFGFVLAVHPLDLYRNRLEGLDYVSARDLRRWIGKPVTTIGWQITGKTVRTKEGDAMKFVTFEDPTGIYETVFFPKVYHRFCHMLNAKRPYLLKGRVEEAFGAITMTVNRIAFLDR